ncbi:hypothetical protein [Candidatus Puniceispirillum marinum]|uniref:Uncharacterized protein n=1 Tax=Puniceispirillum marinum (strain IMCC1322) TaxID=488538 RepID=D5BQB0_PUNMI|nr:hypothetical protein [Candidatus Puniceispirillum marinum]ADE38608.1 protein of unknown function DUF312 [Candidatus Puniceispirillum marinum IMCC1322]
MIPIISAVASLAGTWMEGKVETQKAKVAVAQRVAAGEQEWNIEQAKNSNSSLKDEWLTGLVSIPLILAFTGNEDIVERGFMALETMPDFYKTAVGVVFAASFGVQKLTQMFKK